VGSSLADSAKWLHDYPHQPPRAALRSRPAVIRSTISARSNSANTPSETESECVDVFPGVDLLLPGITAQASVPVERYPTDEQ
jgi:hypothetical protein